MQCRFLFMLNIHHFDTSTHLYPFIHMLSIPYSVSYSRSTLPSDVFHLKTWSSRVSDTCFIRYFVSPVYILLLKNKIKLLQHGHLKRNKYISRISNQLYDAKKTMVRTTTRASRFNARLKNLCAPNAQCPSYVINLPDIVRSHPTPSETDWPGGADQ